MAWRTQVGPDEFARLRSTLESVSGYLQPLGYVISWSKDPPYASAQEPGRSGTAEKLDVARMILNLSRTGLDGPRAAAGGVVELVRELSDTFDRIAAPDGTPLAAPAGAAIALAHAYRAADPVAAAIRLGG